ncbi:hypothetical protein JXO52_16605 [bacterium]|nr:hypothetical protein [bacterium]
MIRLAVLCAVAAAAASALQAQTPYYVTVSTQKARPLAMGGAYTAVTDHLGSLSFNPAGYTHPGSRRAVDARMVVNPLALFTLVSTDREAMKEDWCLPLAALFQGVSGAVGRVSFGIVFWEESLNNLFSHRRPEVFDGSHVMRQGNSTAGLSIALAPKVSIGVSGTLFRKKEENRVVSGLGYQYGIHIAVKEYVDVGVSFSNFQNRFSEQRLTIERFSDEAVNIGLDFHPRDCCRICVDIRNVSDEGQSTVREPHLGLELTPLAKFSLRGGYYLEDNVRPCMSLGIGLNRGDTTRGFSFVYLLDAVSIDAALLLKKERNTIDRWFILTANMML